MAGLAARLEEAQSIASSFEAESIHLRQELNEEKARTTVVKKELEEEMMQMTAAKKEAVNAKEICSHIQARLDELRETFEVREVKLCVLVKDLESKVKERRDNNLELIEANS